MPSDMPVAVVHRLIWMPSADRFTADDLLPMAEDVPEQNQEPTPATAPAPAPSMADIIEAKRLKALQALQQKQQASTSVPVKTEARTAPVADVPMPDAVRYLASVSPRSFGSASQWPRSQMGRDHFRTPCAGASYDGLRRTRIHM
jgi:hypothetical protein